MCYYISSSWSFEILDLEFWRESYGFQGKRVLSYELDSTMKVYTNLENVW
jgi:hypothetical protein